MLQSVVNKRNNCKAVYNGTLSWYFVEHKNVWHKFAAIIFGGAPARKGLMEKALLLYVCSMSSSSNQMLIVWQRDTELMLYKVTFTFSFYLIFFFFRFYRFESIHALQTVIFQNILDMFSY